MQRKTITVCVADGTTRSLTLAAGTEAEVAEAFHNLPVVLGAPDAVGLVVSCPFCGRSHFHGQGDGHRVPHCAEPSDPAARAAWQRGYYIIEE